MKNVSDIYPLTPAQAGMLFHTLQSPGSGVYFEQYVCTLKGSLDLPCFQQAWQKIIERHAVLRTAFIWEGLDEPLQVVRGEVELPLAHIDWCKLSETEQHERLEAYIQTDRTRGFDPAKAPLLRLALFQTAPDVHQFVWSFHHLQLDGWSTGLLLEEVFDSYEILRRGELPIKSPPRAFKDYVAWLQQQDIKEAESFWKNELEGFTSPTALRIDRGVAPKKATGSYQQQQTKLSASVTTALQLLAQQHRLTLNTIFQGAWAILLSRYSSEGDVLFGTTVSGRPADLLGVESMIGMFINTLPTRIQLNPDTEILPWLKNIQSRQLALRRFEYSPLVEIQSWSDIPKGRALFDTIVVFENYPVDGTTFQNGNASLHIENVRYLEQSNYPLSVLVEPGKQLQLYIIYNDSYFDDSVIGRLLGHLETILTSVVTNPMQPIKAIEMLTTAERQQILYTWNNICLDLPQPQQIQQFFEEHVTKKPNTVAVMDKDEQLTYGDLDQKANQLANYLRTVGVVPNTPVGLVLERSADMIVSILGVLKAGGAYLPLDPDYPTERLAFMLSDTQAPVVLTQKKLAGSLPEHNAKLVFIDSEWDAIALQDSTAPHFTAEPNNLAYVIYTSGSMGKPKGVMVSHRNLVHSTSARFQFYKKKVNRFLLLSSFTFDSSVVGIFWTLCQGGTLVLPAQRTEQDIKKLVATIDMYKISHILTLPSLYTILLEQSDAKRLASLNTVIVAGEECRRGLVDLHYTRLPQATLFNEYGPTECTVWSTAYKIPTSIEGDCVPIGRPIPNTQNYILDSHHQLAPIGVPGELCIGGAGVTSGYLNRPELTAEKFFEVAIAGESITRLYRSGDLARYLPDGNIVFLGRIDHQIKIRGYRIELKEIEAIIDGHPAVEASVVVAGKREEDSQRLFAYIVYKPNLAIDSSALRRFLQSKLPDYTIPAHFIVIDKMPLNANGKIDRDALPPPARHAIRANNEYVAPKTQLEKTLSSIWAKCLHVDRVGITDNFFESGGDSLLALRLIADMKSQADIDISPAAFLRNPSIEKMVFQPKNEISVDGDSSIVPIQPKGSKVPIFIFSLPATIFSYFDDDQPIYRFRDYWDDLPFPYNHDSIEKIAQNYIADLIKTFPNGPYILCGYSAGGMIAFEMGKQLIEDNEKTVFLFLIDPTVPTRTQLDNQSAASVGAQGKHRYAHITSAVRENPLRGVWFVIRKLFEKLRNEIRFCNFYLLFKLSRVLGYHLPLKWRRPYVLRLHGKITRLYNAQIYPGPVTMCQTQRHFEQFEWRKLFSGDYEYHVIRETDQHGDLFHDKRIIEIWINHLKLFLDRI